MSNMFKDFLKKSLKNLVTAIYKPLDSKVLVTEYICIYKAKLHPSS